MFHLKIEKSWTFYEPLKLATSYFSGMWKFRYLQLHKWRIYPTLTSLSAVPFFPLFQWSFHLISITTQDWTGLWISSPNLSLLHQPNWFRLQTSLICKKEKKASCEKWLLGGVLLKKTHKIHKNFTKHIEKIPVLEPLSNTVKGLQAIMLETLLKRDPVLVFQNPVLVFHTLE